MQYNLGTIGGSFNFVPLIWTSWFEEFMEESNASSLHAPLKLFKAVIFELSRERFKLVGSEVLRQPVGGELIWIFDDETFIPPGGYGWVTVIDDAVSLFIG